MPWDVQYRDGLYLPQIDWWLDAHHPVDRSFVSHAHFDHLAPHREILCSEGTARLMRARMPAERHEHVLPFGTIEQLSERCVVSLHAAGHIFGSAQSLLEHGDHGRLLYTGDFKLRPGLSAERCETPHADVLIMETTYGRPHYRFPSSESVLRDMVHFCHETLEDREVPVLFGYSLGKSQEILAGLSGAGIPVMLHPQTLRMTRIYTELGIAFPPFSEFDAKRVSGHAVICPPLPPNSPFLRGISKRRTAVLTGWALDPGAQFRYQCDAAFPLSDHADFDDLLRFVELVQPKQVLTLHGFASDFARTLRERGIEAWAISEENQLEFAIAATSGPATAKDTRPLGSSCEEPAPATLCAFARTAEKVKATPRKLEKIALIADYLRSLSSPDEIGLAALYFSGRPFPQVDGRALHLGWSLMRRAVLAVSSASVADFKLTYQRFRDSGETSEHLLSALGSTGNVTLVETAALFDAFATAKGPTAKLALLESALKSLAPSAAKYLIKIISGDLRIGLKEGLIEEALASATERGVDEVREANMLSGDLALVGRLAAANELRQIALTPFRPIQFMLASPEPTAEAILERLAAPVWLEEKYDGIRCQLHKRGAKVRLFSRDLHDITHSFSELATAVGACDADFVLDGELLAWRDGRALPFAELQKRLGRKGGDDFFLGSEIPISFSAFDLLWFNGNSQLGQPLRGRRALLETILARPVQGLLVAPVAMANTVEDIEAAFIRSRERGNEGLMAKSPESLYTPGRRGLAWLKLKKAYATLDVVVVGVESGHGKRKGVLSDYTFSIRDDDSGALLTVGKAYSGLTDAEIAQLTEHFIQHTIEERGAYRTVEPNVILEIAFDSIQASTRHQSGFALRFPRIVRIRDDKRIEEIDTLATCRRLAGSHAFAPPS